MNIVVRWLLVGLRVDVGYVWSGLQERKLGGGGAGVLGFVYFLCL